MSKFIIDGGVPLKGELTVAGSKNAALPIIAASILIKGDLILDNIPRILDVQCLLDILVKLGAVTEWQSNNKLLINTDKLVYQELDWELVKKIRSSVLLLGPLLARFGKITISEPGGCIIGNRPLDTHFGALLQLGVQLKVDRNFRGRTLYHLEAVNLQATEVVLREFSVTATENLIMAALNIEGETTIQLAAQEPHVQDLISFLNKAGAQITLEPLNKIRIKGVGGASFKLNHYRVVADYIEAGTFLVLAALYPEIILKGFNLDHLTSVVNLLRLIGVTVKDQAGLVSVSKTSTLKSFKLQAMPYPGFPTDLQAPFALLASQASGTSLIHDPLFENRMSHLAELSKMGVSFVQCDPHRVLITGPTKLVPYDIKSLNLRAGITMILAGLLTEGQTIIHEAENVDRGYQDIVGRISSLGGKIKRVED